MYQNLLGCRSSHGGKTFEILTNKEGTQILSLHKWAEHDHPTMLGPNESNGNGLILYFLVNELEPIWKNAKELNAIIESEPHLNKNSGRMEFSLKDLDNYYISVAFAENVE